MTIDFDKYKSGEPITIIENGISKTYTCPKISLTWTKCFPPTNRISFDIANRISFDIVGEDVIYENLKE